jgi:hypothetical protein
MEMVRPVLASISGPALRAALQEAHAERLGIWVAIWPVSLLVLSQILEKKMQELRNTFAIADKVGSRLKSSSPWGWDTNGHDNKIHK